MSLSGPQPRKISKTRKVDHPGCGGFSRSRARNSGRSHMPPTCVLRGRSVLDRRGSWCGVVAE